MAKSDSGRKGRWPETRWLFTAFLPLAILVHSARAQDPLPSWNDTAPKKAIAAFVEKVTKEGSSDFVPPNECIATFDNDGTLWVDHSYSSLPSLFIKA